MVKIDETLAKVTARIHQAAQLAQRNPQSVRLIAVSKTQPADAIRTAYNCGQKLFGENYLQEALEKQTALADLTDIEWHFIGPIQSNKTRSIAENFAWVHSIDRLKIAERLSAQRPTHLPALQVCLQINIDDESSKSGASFAEAPALAHAIALLPKLKLRGFMCIPKPTQHPKETASAFGKLRGLLEELNRKGLQLDTLSMGMSSDLEIAIAQGATLVRIGTDIFGARDLTKSHTAINHG